MILEVQNEPKDLFPFYYLSTIVPHRVIIKIIS